MQFRVWSLIRFAHSLDLDIDAQMKSTRTSRIQRIYAWTVSSFVYIQSEEGRGGGGGSDIVMPFFVSNFIILFNFVIGDAFFCIYFHLLVYL